MMNELINETERSSLFITSSSRMCITNIFRQENERLQRRVQELEHKRDGVPASAASNSDWEIIEKTLEEKFQKHSSDKVGIFTEQF